LVDDRELILARDRAGEAERRLETLVNEARDGINFTSALRAEEQAETAQRLSEESHRLNRTTALFLPMTALASVFSMTLQNGFETTAAPWPFVIVVAAGAAISLAMRPRGDVRA
jgi:Mg2+ and Co2+ transporter CorA